MVGLGNQNHRLNLAFEVVEIGVECEDCGREILIPKRWFVDADFLICSTCTAKRAYEYRLKILREKHSRDFGSKVPPMIHINTQDLPGFVKDDLARRIGETLSLFNK